MDAKLLTLRACCALFLTASLTQAATHATPNFVVTAPTEEIARKVADCAEFWRRDLAIQWLGEPLPTWYKPCTVTVKVGQIGAGGQTTFTFENGQVFGWRMQIQGSLERILDSVVPHEVNHTIFASHFRRPLPRWADEGAATLFEHESERARQTKLLNQVMNTSRRIPLKDLLNIKEYPPDMQDVLTLYAEGFSLADYLIGRGGPEGRQVYLRFLHDAHKLGWARAVERNYGYGSLEELEKEWSGWVLAGSPEFRTPAGQQLAQQDAPPAAVAKAPEEMVFRGQNPQRAEPQSPAVSPVEDSKPASQVAAVVEPPPLSPITRQLRVGRNLAEPVPESPRTTGSATPVQSVQLSSEGVAEEFRAREGNQRRPQSSLPPTTLFPTADGIRSNPDAEYFDFPQARR